MKLKTWLKYLAYIAIIFILMYLKAYITSPLIEEQRRTFKITPYYFLIPLIFNAAIGVVLGLDHFFTELKTKGTWRINLPQLIFMGLPSLYFSISIILAFTSNELSKSILFYPATILIFKDNTTFITIFQLILGYALISCFYKQKSND